MGQSKKLYVGNIEYSVTEDDLQELFSRYGTVAAVKIIPDKGFGFVDMADQQEASAAKEELDRFDLKGRQLRVDFAKPRENSPRGNSSRKTGYRD